jgi:hypothetical protein
VKNGLRAQEWGFSQVFSDSEVRGVEKGHQWDFLLDKEGRDLVFWVVTE